MIHTPVLLKEVLTFLNLQPGDSVIDATINGGGHAEAMLERVGKQGKLLGIDWDCGLIDELRSTHHELQAKNVALVCGNFADIENIAKQNGFSKVEGILFDLGFSSYHIEQSGRGFSFRKDEPLDMRYDTTSPLTASHIVNSWQERAIRRVLGEYGEERFAPRIARRIVETRRRKRIERTRELVELLGVALPGWYRRRKIHFATKTFQALRIAVNNELENIQRGVAEAVSLLADGGRLAVISFHSLEDRIVKNIFNNKKKPVRASPEECIRNSRARSAKLRVFEKV